MTTIPSFTLDRAATRVRPELEARWARVVDATAFVGGPEVGGFEAAFGRFLDASACAAVANGTDALVLALRALGVAPTRPDAEVIVPAFTFAATASTVVWAGARPVFADVEPNTLNLDPARVAERIGPNTVGVLGVHLYGRPFDVAALTELCERHGLWLLEDAAQAHGARIGEARVGTLGELATWSFYPSKNLGCFGDGGAVTGRSSELVEKVRLLRHHGQTGRYHHEFLGTNSRLDSLQAAVLNCRLPLLEDDNRRRREIAQVYVEAMRDLDGLRLLEDPAGTEPVHHQFTVLTSRRDELQEYLAGRGIGTAIHYPEPLHHQPALVEFAPPDEELPVSVAAAREALCLPMFAELADAEVAQVCDAVREFFS